MPVAIVGSAHRADPLLGYGFAILMSNKVKGWFTECSGLGVEREIKEQIEGGVNDYVHQLPGSALPSNMGWPGPSCGIGFKKACTTAMLNAKTFLLCFTAPT
jgi:hypothetical protein